MSTGATGSVALPVTFDAPNSGTGSVPVRIKAGTFPVDSTTLTVNVATSVTMTGPSTPTIVAANTAGQAIALTVNNGGGAISTVNFTHNCASLGANPAAQGCSVTPSSTTSLANGATALTFGYASGAAGSSSTVTVSSMAGATTLASKSFDIRVASATVTPPAAFSIPFSTIAQSASFTILNNGPGTITYYPVVSCSTGLQPCNYGGSNPTLAQGASTAAAASYTPGVVGSGTLTLEVRLNSTTGPVVASGTVNVTVQGSQQPVIAQAQQLTGDSLLFRDQCLSLSLGSDVASECGDLRVVHSLPTVRVMNVSRTPTLTYNSSHARPYVVVPVELTLPASSQVPSLVSAVLKIAGTQYATGSWAGAQWALGTTRRGVLAFDAGAAGLATGVYAYTLDVTTAWGAATQMTGTTGQLVVVNRMTSPLGAGWWVAGVEKLDLTNATSPVWVGGDGSVRKYKLRAGSVAPNRVWGTFAMSYPDSIREVGTEFVRQLPDSVWVFFDATGRHVRTRNRQGHVTNFGYDGSGRLSTITLPPSASPTVYNFNYDANGRLATVTAPGNSATRTVTVTTDAATGRITSIQDPGTNPVRTVSFGYTGATHRITSRTNGRGVVTTFAYDTVSRVSSSTLAMTTGTIVRTVTNWQTFGRLASADTSTVGVTLTGPRPSQTTTFRLNRFGAPIRITDALAQVTIISRKPAMPGLVLATQNPAGHVVSSDYDARGRILYVTQPAPNGVMGTQNFTWDTKWDQVTKITNPAGDFTDFGVDAATGNRTWQQDARGLTSKVSFTYNAANQVETVVAPDASSEAYFYDAKGNLNEYDNQVEKRWTYTNNASTGLTTGASVPTGTGAGGSPFEITTNTFSDRNEVLTSTIAAGGANRTITNVYDAESNLTSVTRSWTPNPQSIANQVTTYVYDNADRATTRTESTGGTETTGYDEAGNPTSVATRSGGSVGMGYDLLNRMTSRTIGAPGAFTYPAPLITPATGVETAPYNYTVGTESQIFTYHPTNQVATATGLDANVTRGYHSSGALMSETLVIKTRARTGTPHTYTLTYGYDVNGRRTSLTLGPSALFTGSAMGWSYTTWGALNSITDIAGNSFTFGYNNRAFLTSVAYPRTVAQRTLGYDAAGQLSSDLITRGGSTSFPYPNGTTLRNFSVTSRNARGQILQATDQLTVAGGGYPKGTYDAFGNLTSDSLVQKGYTLANGTTPAFTQSGAFTYDGLGNMLTSSGGWSLPPSASTYATTNTYATTGRLSQQVNNSGSTPQTTVYSYDSGGNTRFEVTTPSGSPNVNGERATYYRGDDQVAAVDKRTSGRRTLEEYRYDPLGRRVWVSTTTTCAPTNDVSCLTSAVRRTIWDGSRELAEIQAPIDLSSEELDSGFPTFPAPSSTLDPNPFFGRVVYAGGLAIDQPLSVTRYDYKDNPGTSLTWPRFTLFPMWDHRGTPVFGLFSDSAQYKPYAKGPTQTACPPPGDNTPQRCVHVTWPFAGDPYDKAKGGLLTLSWLGSQLQTRRDGSGLEYLRHRLYDPKTGRFTQEDPIGLAGGLNAYGYASGDPINFSDPLGLWPTWGGIRRAVTRIGIGLIGLLKAGLPHTTPEPTDMITDPPPIEQPVINPSQDVDSARARRSDPEKPPAASMDVAARIGTAWLTDLWLRQFVWLSTPNFPATPPRVPSRGTPPPIPPWFLAPIMPE